MAPTTQADDGTDITTDLDDLKADWTPKQTENWENHGEPVYERIEDEDAREMYLRTWRPKMRNDGMMKRDHVEIGTDEHYILKEVEDSMNPMGSMQGVVMAGIMVDRDRREDLKELADEILRAKVKRLDDESPAAAKRLLNKSKRVARLYGAI